MGRPIRLGLLEGTVDTEGYKTSVRNAITQACRGEGAELICLTGGPWKRSPYKLDELRRNILYHLIRKEDLDGIILLFTITAYAEKEETAELLEMLEGIPKVSLGFVSEDIPHIRVPGGVALRRILDHLVQVHHYQDIAFVTGTRGNEDAENRLDFFLDYQRGRGIPEEKILVEEGDFQYSCSEKVIDRLLERNPSLDAIVFSNDQMAFGAMERLREKGLTIPEDIAVTGFDDSENADFTSPPLTTVRQPYEEIGRRLVKGLLKGIKGPSVDLNREELDLQFKIRSSCGCTPSSIQPLVEEEISLSPDKSFPELEESHMNTLKEILTALKEDLSEQDQNRRILQPLMGLLFSFHWGPDGYNRWNRYFVKQEESFSTGTPDKGKIFEKIRLLLSERKRTLDLSRLSELETRLELLHEFTRRLYLCTSHHQIEETLLEWLPKFKIRFAQLYLFPSLYIESKTHWPVSLPETIRLVSQIQDYQEERDGVLTLDVHRIFSRNQMKGKGITSMVVGPLFSGNHNLGFMVLDQSINVSVFYESFRNALSAALIQIHNRSERDKAVDAVRSTLRELEESNLQLTEMSFKDALTGLFNRRGFISYADQTLSLARRENKSCLLIYCDMDKMKDINDRFGHGQGDLAIQVLARCLTEEFRGSDGICRMGGDEFLVLAYGSDKKDYPLIVERLHQRLEKESKKLPYNVESSFGCSVFKPDKDSTLRGLMEEADRNLYKDKQNRKDRKRSVYGRE